MRTILSSGVAVCLLIGGGAALVARAPQDGTLQPGQPTQARVLILNRGVEEAVPVSIQGAEPVRVNLATVPTVVVAPGAVVQTQATRQSWEYRDVRVQAGQSASAVLNAEGAAGWETAGFAIGDASGTIVILKRPR